MSSSNDSDLNVLPDLQHLKIENPKPSLLSRVLPFSIFIYLFIGSFMFIYVFLGGDQIQSIFTLHEDVIFALNMSFNIFAYAIPAFTVAMIGSITRILLSTADDFFNHLRIIIGSGFIGVFTFLGLKSGIILDLLVDTVPNVQILTAAEEKKSFYKLMVLCLLTGMFATTIFLTIEERVINLANKIKHS